MPSQPYDFNSRVPPHSLEAERSVLGAILLLEKIPPAVATRLTSGMFYKPAHAKLYSAIETLCRANTSVDSVTLINALGDDLGQVGGAGYIASLLEDTPTSANVEHYAKIVHDHHIRRQVIRYGYTLVKKSQEGDFDSVDAFLGHARTDMAAICNSRASDRTATLADMHDVMIQELQDIRDGKIDIPGQNTGYHAVDDYFGGFKPGKQVVVCADTSQGKTSFALGCALHVSNDRSVGVFSFEMDSEELRNRLIAQVEDVSILDLERRRLTENQVNLASKAAGWLASRPIIINDDASLCNNLNRLSAEAARMKDEHEDLGLVIVDYLQLIHDHQKGETRAAQVARVSASLKIMARELRVSTMVLSQLARPQDQREDKRPSRNRLKESSGIEQDADVVLGIYRQDAYSRHSMNAVTEAEILFLKQRNGPAGPGIVAKLNFNGPYARFGNITKRREA